MGKNTIKEGIEALGTERRGRKSKDPKKYLSRDKDILEELQDLRMEMIT